VPHYTVVEIKRKSLLKGRMRAPDLQLKINEYAHRGLILDKIVSGETASHLVGAKDVFLLIFKEEYEPQEGGGMVEPGRRAPTPGSHRGSRARGPESPQSGEEHNSEP